MHSMRRLWNPNFIFARRQRTNRNRAITSNQFWSCTLYGTHGNHSVVDRLGTAITHSDNHSLLRNHTADAKRRHPS